LKLLFEANLSPKLVGRLDDLFPGSAHVFDTGLAGSTTDEKIREYAAVEGFTIVTADSDFLDIAKSRGAPLRVVHLQNCDYRTAEASSDMTLFGSRNWKDPRESRSRFAMQGR